MEIRNLETQVVFLTIVDNLLKKKKKKQIFERQEDLIRIRAVINGGILLIFLT